jgi:hypothetical protein
LAAKEAKAWIVHIDKHELSYDACFKFDPDFGSRVLGLVDLMFFQLYNAYVREKIIDNINISQICLNLKRSDILKNCFLENKPIYLILNAKKQRDDDEKDPDDLIYKKTKLQDQKDNDNDKDKHPYHDLGNMVKNTQAVQN